MSLKINLTIDPPITKKPYRISFAKRETEKKKREDEEKRKPEEEEKKKREAEKNKWEEEKKRKLEEEEKRKREEKEKRKREEEEKKRREIEKRKTGATGQGWKDKYDRKHKTPTKYLEVDFVVDESVPAITGESHKLEALYKGPYIITKVFSNDRDVVEVIDSNQKRRSYSTMFASDKLKPWCRIIPDLADDSSEDDDDDNGEDADDTSSWSEVAECEDIFNVTQ